MFVANFGHTFVAELGKCRHPAVAGPILSLVKNIQLIRSLVSLPVMVADQAPKFLEFRRKARIGIVGEDRRPDSDEDADKVMDQIFNEMDRESALLLAKDDAVIKDTVGQAYAVFEHLAETGGYASRTGARAILTSALLQAWTAVESFTTDLWVAAVNERPVPLALNFVKPPQVKAQEKSIRISALASHGLAAFDLSKAMGTLLYKEEKADFKNLSSTKFEYDRTFNQPSLTKLLENPQLRLLELVRNVVAHRGGVVDAQFLKDSDGLPLWSDMQEGDELLIDGEMVASFIDNAINQCVAIAQFVDGYLQSSAG